MKKIDYHKGFTLIELMVVIAVIGILAAVILASLSSSRSKAKDAALMSDAKQLQTLLNLEYNETGDYAGLQRFTVLPYDGGTSASCSTYPFTSTNYTVKAREICANIVSNAPVGLDPSDPNNTRYMITGFLKTGATTKKDYSVMVQLSGGRYFCVGSSGTSIATATTGPEWSKPGCYYNP